MNIVVVDDHRDVCAALTGALVLMGMRVTPFLSASAARVGLIVADAPSLLITDVDLGPGEDGPMVAAWMRTLWPALPVIFVSGRPSPALPARSIFLSKPFSLADLKNAIAALTAVPSAGEARAKCA